jgi:hypothetical protein
MLILSDPLPCNNRFSAKVIWPSAPASIRKVSLGIRFDFEDELFVAENKGEVAEI